MWWMQSNLAEVVQSHITCTSWYTAKGSNVIFFICVHISIKQYKHATMCNLPMQYYYIIKIYFSNNRQALTKHCMNTHSHSLCWLHRYVHEQHPYTTLKTHTRPLQVTTMDRDMSQDFKKGMNACFKIDFHRSDIWGCSKAVQVCRAKLLVQWVCLLCATRNWAALFYRILNCSSACCIFWCLKS